MADQCIVCLEDLNTNPDGIEPASHGSLPEHDAPDGGGETSTHSGKSTNQLPIALIKPCNHILHDECLREWSQKANSCPICRHAFNLVEVLNFVGGTVISEYTVEDKKQVAEFDPSAFIQDEFEEEESAPCPVCGSAEDEEVLLLCDGCDVPYHTYCLGLNQVPRGHWFCMECESDGAYVRAAEQAEAQQHTQALNLFRPTPRTQASERRSRQRLRSDHWYGAWSLFSSRVHDVAGLDLDFSEDDQSMETYRRHQRRSDEEARRFRTWQTRLNIASRQGARNVFRQAAPPGLRAPTPPPPTESPEESRAWGAFEKAKELDTASPGRRKRKSRSVTTSPSEPPTEPERKLKRPRTRRVLDRPESSAASPVTASSSRQTNVRTSSIASRPASDTNGEPSFLSTLLKEVEMATSDDDTSRSVFSGTTASGLTRITSPPLDYSSPATSPSPTSSTYHTPRASSITPPPHITKRSGSPLSLSSRVEPVFPPAEYSPNRSPPESGRRNENDQAASPTTELRQPRPRRQRPVALPRSEDSSPTRATMSIEAKESINKIVKSALAPHWKQAEITKEQYEKINRDISRKLYEMVADRNLSDEKEKGAWEKFATTEVSNAIKSLIA